MGGNRNAKNFTIHTRGDGRREFYQHDDRERDYSTNNRNAVNNRQQKHQGRGGQQFQGSSGSGYGGRGNRGRGQGNYRGGNPRNYIQDEDVRMDGRANRHQQMYEHSRGRRGRKAGGRPVINYTSGWHKIIIKEAGAYPKEEVLEAVKELVGDDFIPIMFETEGSHLIFFLERNNNVAKAMLNLSGRLTLRNNHKIFISVTDTSPPFRKILVPQIEIIKKVMSDRYSVELNRLDLKNFHNDKTLVREQIFCPLNRPNVLTVFRILVDNCPQVEEIDLSNNQIHTLNDMGDLMHCSNLKRLILEKNRIRHMDSMLKLKGLPIVELTLDGNVLCDKYKDIDSYTSAVRGVFPKVLRLDGLDLPKPIGFEVDDDDDDKLPAVLPSFFCSPDVKGVVVQFIEQYYQVFESDDRSPLEAAYTEDALMSMTCNFPENGLHSKYTYMLLKESRNFRKIGGSEKRISQLHKGRAAVAEYLCRFPKVLHDPSTFVIDIPIQQPTLMHVVLTGVFKQVVDKNPPFRNFIKSMIIVPVGSGFCIANEELYVNPATIEQVKNAFKNPPPPPVVPVSPVAAVSPVASQVASPSTPVVSPHVTPVQSPIGALLPAQLELIKQFAVNSKMLPEYCKMCLERNDWDFTKAGEMFVNLQKENKIPPEYFGAS